MSFDSAFNSLAGGALIGIAVTLMLLFNGRVTGISGILASSIAVPGKEGLWRWTFLLGMLGGGGLMFNLNPELFVNLTTRGTVAIAAAGLLVGYGTVMGSGCTSGHGVCGISRLSVRSLLATLTFMLFGFLTVQAASALLGGS
jgi:uncharacterized membrane protein YedE/YeeE